MPPAEVRLFVALELPPAVRGALATWQAAWSGDQRTLRTVEAESLHVTLCFLGSRPTGEVGELAHACEVARGQAVRDLSLGDVLWLPRRRPRALAVALVDRLGELAAVQIEISRALVAAGVARPERRRFVGHVTVGRVRGDARAPRLQLRAPACSPFDAGCVTLYRSHLGRGPARYEPLHHVELARR